MFDKVLSVLCACVHFLVFWGGVKISVFAFTRRAKFSAKFTERGGAASGIKIFPK